MNVLVHHRVGLSVALDTQPPLLTRAELLRFPQRCLQVFDRWLAGRHWMLVTVLMATVVSLFFAFPTYSAFDPHGKDWTAIVRMLHHPFDQTGMLATDRAYNFTYRVTVPFLGGLLHLPAVGYLVLQAIGGLCLFWATAAVAFRVTASRRVAALVSITTGLMWAGSCAFVEMRGNFDNIALVFLVGAMAVRRWPLVFLLVFLAAWTDERTLAASAFVVLFHHFAENPTDKLLLAFRRPACWAPAAALVAHIVLRLAVAHAYHVKQPSNLGFKYVKEQINILPLGAWTGLEGFWVLVVLGCIVLLLRKQRLALLAYTGVIALMLVGSIAIVDVTRSMAYLLPAAFVGLVLAARNCAPRVVRYAVYAAFVLSLAWPVYYAGGEKTAYWQYPLPLQLVRMRAGLY